MTQDKGFAPACNGGLLPGNQVDSCTEECLMIQIYCGQGRDQDTFVRYNVCCVQSTTHTNLYDCNVDCRSLEDQQRSHSQQLETTGPGIDLLVGLFNLCSAFVI